MDDNELMSIMSDWNFWGNLSGKNWIKRNEYVNYIVNLLKGINIIAISGIRRSGKSIISLQVIEELINRGIDPKDTLIIKLDDERLINPDYELLLRIFDLYLNNIKANSNSPTYLVIDEAQEVVGWERFTRGLSEKGNKIIVTGSSAKLLSSEFTTLLSGRHVEVRVFPLDLKEYLKFNSINFDDNFDIIKNMKEINKGIENLMSNGGFPDIVLHTDISNELISSYFDTIILKDVIGRYKIRDEGKIRALAKFYISSTSTRITYNSISKFLKIPVKTVERYSSYLEKVYLIFFLNNYSLSIKTIENSPRKVHIVDNGFTKIFNPKISRGRLFESLVAQFLYKYSLTKRMEIYYWYDNVEVDLVVVNKDRILPIQVVYDLSEEDTFQREFKALKKFMEKMGANNGIIVIYRGEEREVEGVKIIHAYKFFLSEILKIYVE